MRDEQLHQRRVAHRVLRGHDDLVELDVLADSGRRLQLVRPQFPPAGALGGTRKSDSVGQHSGDSVIVIRTKKLFKK